MRSHFPRTLAPLSPSTPLLPIHQCGSAAPQQPPLPSPLHCPTDHLLPKTLQSRCSPPSTTRTATAILSSEVHGDSLTNPWSPQSLICSHLQPSTSFLVILVSASAVTKCQPLVNTTLSFCLKPLRLCCNLQSLGSPQATGPEQCPTRAVCTVKLSV